MILTENFAALPVVKQLLHEIDSEEPYVIFGSSFPNDQLFTQVMNHFQFQTNLMGEVFPSYSILCHYVLQNRDGWCYLLSKGCENGLKVSK